MLEGILFGHEGIKEMIAFQEKIVQQVGKEKMEPDLHQVDPELERRVRELAAVPMEKAAQVEEKQERQDAIQQVRESVLEQLTGEDPEEEQIREIEEVLDTVLKEVVRRMILEEKKRPDGRSPEEIRPLTSEVGILPVPTVPAISDGAKPRSSASAPWELWVMFRSWMGSIWRSRNGLCTTITSRPIPSVNPVP